MNIPKYTELFRNEITMVGFRLNTIDSYSSCVELFLKYFEGKQTEPSKINEMVCNARRKKNGYLVR